MTPQSVFYPVEPDRYGKRYWKRFKSYNFASTHVVLPLVAAEMSRAAQAFCIAFTPKGERFEPSVVLGLQPGSNLFVANDGTWLGSYIPSVLRSYPFLLLPAKDNQLVLCVDETSGLLSDAPDGGERFFSDTGELSEAVTSVFNFLAEAQRHKAFTQAACDALQSAGLIVPWELRLSVGHSVTPINGLYKVDEEAMDKLPDSEFLKLRRTGAITLAYTQLFSMQHMTPLQHLAQSRAEKALAPVSKDLDLSFMEGDTLRF